MIALLSIAGFFLAFANGANDNFKGFATIWGSKTLSYRTALGLATAATLAGSAVSIIVAQALVARFSGKGLVPDMIAADPAFLFAVGGGAATAVMLATRLGFPISTTHALLGALIGAALGAGGAINYAALGGGFLLPLLLSPMLSAGLGFSAYALLRLRPAERDCVCVTVAETVSAGSGAALKAAGVELIIAPASACAPLATPARFSIAALLDRAHLLSAVTVCFARSVNDTPKLAALLITANAFDPRVSALGIAMAMSLGGLIMARRVAETMSLRISRIDPAQGVSANLITAVLVLSASNFGLPVSTTHVSVGSIAGAGARAGALDWAVLRNVLLSWAATLPIAAAGAALLSLAAALWR